MAQEIRIDAGGWGLTWVADGEGRLRQAGAGPDGHRAEVSVDPVWYPPAHPTWGGGDALRHAALRVVHADGTLTTRLVLDDVRTGPLQDGELVVVRCRDELFSFTVEHHLRTHPASGVLEQWVEIHHDEAGPVTLADYDSIAPLLLVGPSASVTQFGGAGWADEWRLTTEVLTAGTKVLDSLGGVQPHLQRAPFLLVEPDGAAIESGGEVIGLSIGWGGNTRFALDVRPKPEPGAPSELRLRAGANSVGAEYVLDPGATFATAPVAWTWTAAGRAEITHRFHRFARDRVIREPDRLRSMVVNTWEAVGFDFDEARLVDLAGRAGELVGDDTDSPSRDRAVFLLDDGWFGTTHPRDADDAGLGDWDVDGRKLPRGLEPVVSAVEEAGLRFGIWAEPEMVNPRSELYEEHPDWVLRDRREPRQHRQQLLLDPLRAEVRDFEVDVIDRSLATPGTTYLKWDANRPVTDPGSTALAADRRSNVWVDLVRRTWDVMDEVVARHPAVDLMLCASGGGRTDHETLRRFHEVWTSDNTDPVTRVRMQWAFSMFLPASVMAAHVTRWGDRPLPFTCAVALSGRFGFDLDLAGLDQEGWAICRRAVEVARATQGIVQSGILHRLVSPVEGSDRSRAALAYVAPDHSGAVVFTYQLEEPTGPAPPRVEVPGLDPRATYAASSTDLASDDWRAGAPVEGGSAALPWDLDAPFMARIWRLTAR